MSDTPTLHRLISQFTRNRPLPVKVGTTPLLRWLDSLSHDQREFAYPDLAIAIGVTTERPWISEAAAALRFRLEESAHHGAA